MAEKLIITAFEQGEYELGGRQIILTAKTLYEAIEKSEWPLPITIEFGDEVVGWASTAMEGGDFIHIVVEADLDKIGELWEEYGECVMPNLQIDRDNDEVEKILGFAFTKKPLSPSKGG